MYRTEAHVHTCEVSPCGKVPAREMIRLYREAGVDTVFISDHFQRQFFESRAGMTWEAQVDAFFSGYRAAKEAGDALGLTVLPAAEIRFDEDPNHYLVYGLSQEFYAARPDLLTMCIEEFYPIAKSCGAMVVQAHPFRDGACDPRPDHVDAIEVYNTHPRHKNYDEKALEVALAHRKPIAAGSDAHQNVDAARGLMLSAEKVERAEDYARLLLSGGMRAVKAYLES